MENSKENNIFEQKSLNSFSSAMDWGELQFLLKQEKLLYHRGYFHYLIDDVIIIIFLA